MTRIGSAGALARAHGSWGWGVLVLLHLVGALGLSPLVRAAAPPPTPGDEGEGAEQTGAAKPTAPTADAANPPAPTAEAVDPPDGDDGPVAVTTRITPDPSNVGDLLEYEVVAAYPRGYSVNLPSVLSLEPMHLVSVDEAEPEPTGEGLRKVFTVRLQHFDVGEAEVPAFPLTYVTPEGEVQTVRVPAQPFVVEKLTANENDPQRKGEDPPISLKYPNTLAETILYSVAATLVVALLGWLVARRFFGREKVVPAPPPIPPHELARAALDELERGELLDRGEYQAFYLELTGIAKAYLEGRFGIEALDQTTEEIRQQLLRRQDALEPLTPSEVVRFLQQCDLVKFARFEPDPQEARDALAEVRTMVDRTTVTPAKEPGAATSGQVQAEPDPSRPAEKSDASPEEAPR